MTIIYEKTPETSEESVTRVLLDTDHSDNMGKPFKIALPALKVCGFKGGYSINALENDTGDTFEYLLESESKYRLLWMSGRKNYRMSRLTGPISKEIPEIGNLPHRVIHRLLQIVAEEENRPVPVRLRLVCIAPIFMSAIWVRRETEDTFWVFRQRFKYDFNTPIPETEMQPEDFFKIVEDYTARSREALAKVPHHKPSLFDRVQSLPRRLLWAFQDIMIR